MQIASLNIGEKKEVNWGTKRYKTGIFKYPVDKSIYLGKTDVQNDAVIDRKYHGGIDKACYVFGANFYNYFKLIYPELDWNFGMFGENITLFDCNEKEIHLGDIFQIGETMVEVSGPREPCVKLGIRFNTQKIIKDFIEHGQSGFYLRVEKEGIINTNDSVVLVDRDSNAPTIFELFKWRYFSKLSEKQQIEKAINHPKLDPAFARNLLKEISKIETS